MTKRWSTVRSDLHTTKKRASKISRINNKRQVLLECEDCGYSYYGELGDKCPCRRDVEGKYEL